MPRTNPYADAPRLPLDPEQIDVRSLVHGEWIEIEIGPGRGAFILERVALEPRVAMIGFEIRRKWAAIVDARLARAGHAARARVFAEDARTALGRLVPDRSVRRIFLHFPDPWWKKRHQKRAVMGDVLLDAIFRLLEPGGELFIQTDVYERAEAYHARIVGPRFRGGFVSDHPYGARSPREKRAIADGLPIHRLLYEVIKA
jgi:tRNA (guanine-N7-)-methyltransferase